MMNDVYYRRALIGLVIMAFVMVSCIAALGYWLLQGGT